jgi:hypothetical protein
MRIRLELNDREPPKKTHNAVVLVNIPAYHIMVKISLLQAVEAHRVVRG